MFNLKVTELKLNPARKIGEKWGGGVGAGGGGGLGKSAKWLWR